MTVANRDAAPFTQRFSFVPRNMLNYIRNKWRVQPLTKWGGGEDLPKWQLPVPVPGVIAV